MYLAKRETKVHLSKSMLNFYKQFLSKPKRMSVYSTECILNGHLPLLGNKIVVAKQQNDTRFSSFMTYPTLHDLREVCRETTTVGDNSLLQNVFCDREIKQIYVFRRPENGETEELSVDWNFVQKNFSIELLEDNEQEEHYKLFKLTRNK
jgi:hypothetical protein